MTDINPALIEKLHTISAGYPDVPNVSVLQAMHANITKAQYGLRDVRQTDTAYDHTNSLPWGAVKEIAKQAKDAEQFLTYQYREDLHTGRFEFTSESLATAFADYYYLLDAGTPEGLFQRNLVETLFRTLELDSALLSKFTKKADERTTDEEKTL